MATPPTFGSARPPEKGVFPLDHGAECRDAMLELQACLEAQDHEHYKCREFSKRYLQCRMERQLMQQERWDEIGFSEQAAKVLQAAPPQKADTSREEAGFTAGEGVKPGSSTLKKLWKDRVMR